MKFHVDGLLGGVTTNYTADDDDDPGQSLDGTLNFLVGVLIVVTLAFLFLVRRVRNIRRDAETARRLRLERISAHHRAEYGPAFRGDDAISVLVRVDEMRCDGINSITLVWTDMGSTNLADCVFIVEATEPIPLEARIGGKRRRGDTESLDSIYLSSRRRDLPNLVEMFDTATWKLEEGANSLEDVDSFGGWDCKYTGGRDHFTLTGLPTLKGNFYGFFVRVHAVKEDCSEHYGCSAVLPVVTSPPTEKYSPWWHCLIFGLAIGPSATWPAFAATSVAAVANPRSDKQGILYLLPGVGVGILFILSIMIPATQTNVVFLLPSGTIPALFAFFGLLAVLVLPWLWKAGSDKRWTTVYNAAMHRRVRLNHKENKIAVLAMLWTAGQLCALGINLLPAGLPEGQVTCRTTYCRLTTTVKGVFDPLLADFGDFLIQTWGGIALATLWLAVFSRKGGKVMRSSYMAKDDGATTQARLTACSRDQDACYPLHFWPISQQTGTSACQCRFYSDHQPFACSNRLQVHWQYFCWQLHWQHHCMCTVQQ
jgi:hypothetical protein